MIDIIKPKRPTGSGWRHIPVHPAVASMGYPCEAWMHLENKINVISAVEVATDGDGKTNGPEYHISISTWNGAHETRRCDSSGALWVLSEFDLLDADEDNHVPGGQVRNFWRPVAEHLVGIECACKDDEPAIVEDGGDFVWRGLPR